MIRVCGRVVGGAGGGWVSNTVDAEIRVCSIFFIFDYRCVCVGGGGRGRTRWVAVLCL